ncbi:MAG TPA: aminoacyl-tRNA hydrolase [Acholeplasma sp.]|nr:aminoacyl-tRNA hydrolase [Acholeplasma sp.]
MKLIVGLGNPGSKYEQTRHNVGFLVLDELAKRYNVSFALDNNFNGLIANSRVGKEKVILLKPTTFMNLSGIAVSKVLNYFQVPLDDLIVISDDIDLSTGRLRLREGGGHGGHNGLRDIHKHLGSAKYKRIKIGIDQDRTVMLDQYVLGKFSKEEQKLIDEAVNLSADALMMFIENIPYLDIMTKYNTIGKNNAK